MNIHNIIGGMNSAKCRLDPVSKENVRAIKLLSVQDQQQKYIANISDSLIQASFLKDWHGYALVDTSNDSIVGFGSFAKYDKDPFNGIKIYKCMIDQHCQGKGYGKVLVQLLVEKIKELHTVADIYIDPHDDNIAAINLYHKIGFNDVSTVGNTIIMKL